MKTNIRLAVLFISGFSLISGVGNAAPQIDDDRLTTDAISSDPAIAQAAWKQLRDEGPSGMDHLEAKYADQIKAHHESSAYNPLFMRRIPAPADPNWASIQKAINAVGAQYDNVNGLYWYTDLEQAKVAAKAEHKPILSLRLLGNLNEDLSCANSRFFRITLYANKDVSQMLKDKFILHWQSERPVPVVTIDFGNGNKLVRTITGNSIHYILSPDGELVDALPGLYDPATFTGELLKAASLTVSTSPDHFVSARRETERRLLQEWEREVSSVTPAKEPLGLDLSGYHTDYERRLQLFKETTDSTWNAMATRFYPANFDGSSVALIDSSTKYPAAESAARLTVSKMMVESPLIKSLRHLQESVSVDTVKNNLAMRTEILEMSLVENLSNYPHALDYFNEQVYAQVFQTPASDPYLGLESPGIISGIDNDGEQVSSTKPSN